MPHLTAHKHISMLDIAIPICLYVTDPRHVVERRTVHRLDTFDRCAVSFAN